MNLADEIARKTALVAQLREARWDGVDRRLAPRDHSRDWLYASMRALEAELVREIAEDSAALATWS